MTNRRLFHPNSHRGQALETVLSISGMKDAPHYLLPAFPCRVYTHIPRTEEQDEEFRDRDPTKEEYEACRDRLDEYIYAIDPAVIVLMGEQPWKALAKHIRKYTTYVSSLSASTFLDVQVEGLKRVVSYPAVTCPGPREMLRNPSSAEHGPTATAIRILRDLLEAYNYMENHR